MKDDSVTIWCCLLSEDPSGSAIEIEMEAGTKHWLPTSQIGHIPDAVHWPRPVPLIVPDWLAKQEGLI
ncbi:hypothetical protein JCM17845_15230 [Iodidimonas gelatinilytica]|uniref:Uncharacterized protein n=1 Tax=Iodidimonas gelatinilytica TaxID=1236966 RepID=A0A5A7N0N2_9PROT|nr:hypothetical protein JCM17845_15230 [Iodidimonas gelatinilytica]